MKLWARRSVAALAGLVSICATSGVAAAECSETELDLRGDWGSARFAVEIADDDAERSRGLMYRNSLPRSAGMLFVYPKPQRAGFWMKNTFIPLDMVFVGPDGVVTHVHENAVPEDLSLIDGGEGVRAVLEINGGLSGALGIGIGTVLRHPVFGLEAAWPCAD